MLAGILIGLLLPFISRGTFGSGAGAGGVVTPTDDVFIKLDKFEKQHGADSFQKGASWATDTTAEKQWPKAEAGIQDDTVRSAFQKGQAGIQDDTVRNGFQKGDVDLPGGETGYIK